MNAAESDDNQQIVLEVFGRTDVGQIREHNEDNFLVADLTRKSRTLTPDDRAQVVGNAGTLLAVCDGMGGAAAGEVASQMAVDIVYERMLSDGAPRKRDDLAHRLVDAVEEAGQRIFEAARADRTRRGMGTTATIAALVDSRLFVAQVGDSRCYVLREGRLAQVTRDQSLVNQLIEAGQLTEEEAETFEHNNIILQALGTADAVQVDLTYADLRAGDLILLCSDGLSGMIRNEEIRQVLLAAPGPLEACQMLTERANLAGGHDNVTVIVARVGGPAALPPGPDAEPLGYRKYAVAEAGADNTLRTSVVHAQIAPGPVSDEAQRESRSLKVGHTLMGIVTPATVPEGAPPPPPPALEAPSVASGPTADSTSPKPPRVPPAYQSADDPISIPTTGWPAPVVFLLVVATMVGAALVGYFCVP
jgi:serine/threonine protein phosphatase PrpC